VSRAHHGVHFLDKLPEFRRHVSEVLRQSLLERSQRLGGKAGSDLKNGRRVEHGYRPFPQWMGCLSFLCLSACTRLFSQPSRVLIQKPQRMGISYQDVSLSSANGTRLQGWFFPAQTRPIKGTVVQVHGNAENISTHFGSLA
jgi:Magnesium chelatase, subunit ChlI